MGDQEPSSSPTANKAKVLRCIDWLQKQNSQEVKKSIQNKNDIQFIIQINADRKNFLLSTAEDEATVPAGIEEPDAEPQPVPLRSLRVQDLRLECDWQNCRYVFTDYDEYQKHVYKHCQDVHVINKENDEVSYVCLWDTCGFKTDDYQEMVRHVNYHAYHGKLLAVGFNGRATLKLPPCNKDSTKRNQLPVFKSYHCCMWTDCNTKFNSMQLFLDHVKHHVKYIDKFICSWAGCGVSVARRTLLVTHMRSHTGEKMIACYHCGAHFANNSKLIDHLRRQNVNPLQSFECSLCGAVFASRYLCTEHARRHVSLFACALCDMTAQSRAALALHVQYRHLPAHCRLHACPDCPYRAIRKNDLDKHILTHTRKRKKRCDDSGSDDLSDSEVEVKKKKVRRQYACHLCPEKEMKVFSRGSKLTTHLVNKHGAQWTFGHSRFRYQISDDGIYRLTTTRYEDLEVSQKIVDGENGPKEPFNNELEFTIKQTAEATEFTPKSFEVVLKGNEDKIEPSTSDNKIEILMCDVDEKGNIIKSEIINDVVMST